MTTIHLTTTLSITVMAQDNSYHMATQYLKDKVKVKLKPVQWLMII
jgi:N12 class adenine-specific DNA methylase